MHPYFKYYFSASTKYQVHSPFVFEFLSDIFEDDRFYHFFGVIEHYRRNLLGTSDKLLIEGEEKSINQLVKKGAIQSKIGEILFKTVHKYKPTTLVEIGDSLGISALYQATPNPHVPLLSLVPNSVIGNTTENYFKRLGTRNVELLAGDIAKNIVNAIQQLKSIDHLFFNGFWGKTTTLSYFEACLAAMPANATFVFKSPYASKETQAFWETIKKHEKVRLSVDIYDLGFLFFRSEQKEVTHYQIIESWKKPWAIY